MGRRGISAPSNRRRTVTMVVALGLAGVAVVVAAAFVVRGLRFGGTPDSPFAPAPVERPTNATVFQADTQVLFDSNSSSLRPAAEQVLARIAEQIRTRFPTRIVRVEGYTDDVGSDGYNASLSESRANEVARWLTTTGGIGGSRLQVRGYGEADPAQPNDSDEHRQANRRVVIRVVT